VAAVRIWNNDRLYEVCWRGNHNRSRRRDIPSSIQSIQFSGGAGGLAFSNQQGVWQRTGKNTVEARVLDIGYNRATGSPNTVPQSPTLRLLVIIRLPRS
jgi:hypothetical protein